MNYRFTFCVAMVLAAVAVQAAAPVESAVWEEVRIENTDAKRQAFFLDFKRWAYADLLYRIDGGPLQHKRTGELVPYRLRDYPFANTVLIRIELEAGEVMAGQVWREWRPYMGSRPVRGRVEISSEEEMRPYLWKRTAISLVATSILLFILIYNLIFYSATRNRLYIFYLLSIFSILLETMRSTGLLLFLFGGIDGFALQDKSVAAAITLLLTLSMSCFMDRLLPYVRRNSSIFQYFYLFMILSAVSMYILSWIDFQAAFELVSHGYPPFLIVLVWGALINLFKGKRYPILIFTIVSIYTLTAITHIAGISAWIEMSDDLFIWSLAFGIIVADTLMTFLLGRIVWDLRQENARQRAKLIRNLRKQKFLQQQLALSILEIQEGEHRSFAQRLHDDLQNQLVTLRYAMLGLRAAPPRSVDELEGRKRQLQKQTEECLRTVREIAFELMPSGLEGPAGLSQAIGSFLEPVSRLDLKVRYRLEGDLDLPLEIKALAFRIVEELVTNALKYAEAGKIEVLARHVEQSLEIRVTDDGKGAGEGVEMRKGHGLANISTNIAMYGGWLDIQQPVRGGMAVVVYLKTGLEREWENEKLERA